MASDFLNLQKLMKPLGSYHNRSTTLTQKPCISLQNGNNLLHRDQGYHAKSVAKLKW
jgi:hypothetical protein